MVDFYFLLLSVRRGFGELTVGNRAAVLKYAPDSISDEIKGVEALSDVAAHDIGSSEGVVARLGAVKGKYDPSNFFCQNANIKSVL